MDDVTARGDRLSFARVLIEITAEEAQARSVEIENEKGVMKKQQVVFEWLPKTCNGCKKFGHLLC